MISEREMLEQLERGIEFPPLAISLRTVSQTREPGIDAVLKVRSEDQTFEFAAELSARSTPRGFEEALNRIEKLAARVSSYPLLLMPYLRESQLEELQERQISGIDLSGNGVITIPGKLLVYRTGKPNQFPDSAPTKYAYRGNTSLVARVFLCRTVFESLADIEEEMKIRGGSVALSTISKALKRMESDLIIDRSGKGIRLRQADALLEKLAESYQEPKVIRTVTCSISEPLEKLLAKSNLKSRSVLSGRSSISAYAVMGRDDTPVLYVENIDDVLKSFGTSAKVSARFVDLELRQTSDSTVYFDIRTKENVRYASPVQAFLECSVGDKREQEAAAQVKDTILQELRA